MYTCKIIYNYLNYLQNAFTVFIYFYYCFNIIYDYTEMIIHVWNKKVKYLNCFTLKEFEDKVLDLPFEFWSNQIICSVMYLPEYAVRTC